MAFELCRIGRPRMKGTAMTLAEIIRIADEIAPPGLAMDKDPIGLQAGDPAQAVTKVAVCLDLTLRVLGQAQREGAQAVIAHHPVIYRPLASVAETSPQGRLLAEALRSRMGIYVVHTNWDAAQDGMNDALAQAFGIAQTRPLEPASGERYYKLVVFVPDEAIDAVRMAMGSAGAGRLGNYTHCSFRSPGTGSFLPTEGASPHIGEINHLEDANEWRLEALVSHARLASVLQAVLQAHPYEEPAYDIIPVQTPPSAATNGIGRIGKLTEPVPFAALKTRVLKVLGSPPMRAQGDDDRLVSKVAVCGGAGGDLIQLAHTQGAEAYITGDVRRHEFVLAEAMGLAVIDATHEATETLGMKHFARRLASRLSNNASVVWVE